MKDSNLKITSMKDIYEWFLEQGYNVTIDNDNSFISVIVKDFIVCGDDDLVTSKGKKDLFTTSSHVISGDLYVYINYLNIILIMQTSIFQRKYLICCEW